MNFDKVLIILKTFIKFQKKKNFYDVLEGFMWVKYNYIDKHTFLT